MRKDCAWRLQELLPTLLEGRCKNRCASKGIMNHDQLRFMSNVWQTPYQKFIRMLLVCESENNLFNLATSSLH